jgi:Glycosyl hydrolases family 25
MALYGVDVHARYQGGLDVALLARQGYSFLATKLSQGLAVPSVDGFTAAQFKARALSWLEQTRTAGMVPGGYHWIDVSASGAAQARFFYGLVKQAGGPEGMLIQLDNEDNATWQTTKDWAAEWEQLSGGHPWLMYTGRWWWGPRGWDGASLTPLLWDSRYLSADSDTIPDDPAAFAARIPTDWWRLPDLAHPGVYGYGGWTTATFLQFTSRGDAGSLGNNVDLNAFRGAREQLLGLTGGDMALTDADITKLLAAKLGSSGPTVGIALQATYQLVSALAGHTGMDPTVLASILAAAEQGAHQGISESADDLAQAIVARLSASVPSELSIADVETAVRAVLLDAATP